MALTAFLRRPPDRAARLRLFCAAHAGGGAALYAPWRRLVPSWLDICPLQLPARESRFREPARTDLRALATELAKELSPHLDLPFALLGYSLGGLITFELTHALYAQCLPLPQRMMLGAARAPQTPRTYGSLIELNDDDFLAELGRRYGGMRPEVLENKALRSLILPSLRGDFRMLESYQYVPSPPLNLPIYAFAGADDTITSPAEVASWQVHTTAEFKLHTLPGGHFFINSHRSEFLSLLLADLAPLGG